VVAWVDVQNVGMSTQVASEVRESQDGNEGAGGTCLSESAGAAYEPIARDVEPAAEVAQECLDTDALNRLQARCGLWKQEDGGERESDTTVRMARLATGAGGEQAGAAGRSRAGTIRFIDQEALS
jgi:hypothetical protein